MKLDRRSSGRTCTTYWRCLDARLGATHTPITVDCPRRVPPPRWSSLSSNCSLRFEKSAFWNPAAMSPPQLRAAPAFLAGRPLDPRARVLTVPL